MKRLSRLFRFKAPPKAPFGLSATTYFSVLSTHAAWPTLFEIVNPKGDGFAVPGYGIPKAEGANKSDLRQPMERGAYWITSPDRTTVLTLRLMSKEEAGFDPDAFLASEFAQSLSPAVRTAVAASWGIGQLTFDSHHPGVLPAMDFAIAIAVRLAERTEGVVADPSRFTYALPTDYAVGPEFLIENHIAVFTFPERHAGARLTTRGLAKFGLPEWELNRVPEEQIGAAEALLYSIAFTILTKSPFEVGDTVGSAAAPFQVALAIGAVQPDAAPPSYELIPANRDTISECLAAWQKENQ